MNWELQLYQDGKKMQSTLLKEHPELVASDVDLLQLPKSYFQRLEGTATVCFHGSSPKPSLRVAVRLVRESEEV